MRHALTILVPVFNEGAWLSSSFEDMWSWLRTLELESDLRLRICFCLWSEMPADVDPDARLLATFIATLPACVQAQVVTGRGASSPSVMASLRLALDLNPEGLGSPYTLICPIDCSPTAAGLREILTWSAVASGHSWAVFGKTYSGPRPNRLLQASALLQNALFSPVMGWHCWTHLFVLPTDDLDELLRPTGFLEDVALNALLTRARGRPFRFKTRAQASARRYAKRGEWRQMVRNVSIFAAYLTRLSRPQDLRERYERD